MQAHESERAWVSAELHDEVGQSLTALLVRLRAAAERDTEVRGDLMLLGDQVRTTLDEVRRISARLGPGLLRDLGLVAALRALADQTAELGGLDVDLDVPASVELPDETALIVYRIAQEALTNVLRHSGARRVRVALLPAAGGWRLEVVDDGRGGIGQDGTGITGMRERARLARGRLAVASERGRGTAVRLQLPASVGWDG